MPGRRSSVGPPSPAAPRDPAPPGRRRPLPGRAGRGAGAGRCDQARPVLPASPGGAVDGGDDLRQADAADPGLLLRRHRRAGRLPAGGRRCTGRDRRPGVRCRRRPGARAVRPPRSCGAPGRSPGWRRWPSTRACRWSTRSPTTTTPASCSPTCSPSPSTGARWPRSGGRVRRRRRVQHGQLVAAGRCDRGHARADRGSRGFQPSAERGRPGGRDRRDHRRLGRRAGRARVRRSRVRTSW